MARPLKDGVDYFPVDTDFFQDDKVRLIKGEFGAKGVVILLALLCEIYRGSGYYKVWDKDSCLLMADAVGCGISPENITQVVRGCLRRSIFDSGVFQMFSILTSAGIQRRYIRAVSTRDKIFIKSEFWLLNNDDPKDVPAKVLSKLTLKSLNFEKTAESFKKTPVSSCFGTQSKGEESKGEYRREEETETPTNGVPSAPPITRESLICKYGDELVSAYLAKAKRYHKAGDEAIATIAQWLAVDQAEGKIRPQKLETSLDLAGYDEMVKGYIPVYKQGGG